MFKIRCYCRHSTIILYQFHPIGDFVLLFVFIDEPFLGETLIVNNEIGIEISFSSLKFKAVKHMKNENQNYGGNKLKEIRRIFDEFEFL